MNHGGTRKSEGFTIHDSRFTIPAGLVAALAVVGAGVAGYLSAGRFMRFVVEGESMLPAYGPGDWLVVDLRAFEGRLPRVGEVVVAHDPRHATRKLIKRVKSVDRNGNVWLEGDNPWASTDSRHFGAVEQVVGLVRWRYRRG